MSNDPTTGITNSSYRQVIRKALDNGWVFLRMTGTTHGVMAWPPTGERVTFGFTVSPTSFKSKAAEIKKISGVECWTPPKRGRSRKKDQVTDFSLQKANHEHVEWRDKFGERIDHLRQEHADLIQSFAELREAEENRTAIDKARKILKRVLEVEQGLENMHQTFQKFDPFNNEY